MWFGRLGRGRGVGGGGSVPPTPHLTSPLRGERDELGKGGGVGGRGVGVGGSCLRRNDGWGRRNDGEGERWVEGLLGGGEGEGWGGDLEGDLVVGAPVVGAGEAGFQRLVVGQGYPDQLVVAVVLACGDAG